MMVVTSLSTRIFDTASCCISEVGNCCLVDANQVLVDLTLLGLANTKYLEYFPRVSIRGVILKHTQSYSQSDRPEQVRPEVAAGLPGAPSALHKYLGKTGIDPDRLSILHLGRPAYLR